MSNFWQFSRYLLHEKAALFWAMVFAFFSAGGLAAGLMGMWPLLKLMLDPRDAKSLVDLARDYNSNAQHHAFTIPDGVIALLPADRFQGVVVILLFVLALTLMGGAANFLHQYLSQTVTTRAIARIRREAFENVIFMPLVRVVSRGPSEFVARIVRDAAELQRGMIALVSKTIAQILQGAAAGLVALLVDWKLTLIAVPTVILLGVVLRKIGKRIRRGTRGSLKAQEGLLRISTEALQGLRSVKANTGESQAIQRFDETNAEVVRHELKVRTARALSSPVVESLAMIAVIILGVIAAHGIIVQGMPLDRFVLALGALGMAGAKLRPVTGFVNEIQAASAPAERLGDILREGREVQEKTERTKPRATRHGKSIEIDRVTLTYPGADVPALRGVSLNILHGERVAIVGPNGSGKTTLVSLLPRLLTPDSGRIVIDGIDIAAVNLHSLRSQIGVVTQETVLFRGTIAENIAYGLGGATRQQIIDAARRAHADEFIQKIPGGYDADILEQGASLSGGQRQRLAIARAILRDPSMLILDEATSQIDADSEGHINAALADFCRHRTSLIIAHRLSTVLNADRIVVMDAGRIVDQGRHEPLLERCELYRRLSRTQLVGAIS